MPLNLIQKQKQFPGLLCQLIAFAIAGGYEITFGEVWRPASVAAANQRAGTGILHSLHCIRLAVDLNVFKDGKLLTRSAQYLALGEFWESLSTEHLKCCWGGRFSDGNHFSIEHNGVK